MSSFLLIGYDGRVSPVSRRSISLPEDVDAAVEAAAVAAGLSVSAWLARVVEHHFRLRRGLAGIAEWEAEHGAFTDEELEDGRAWATRVLSGEPPGPITRRSA